jgi:hypothetical protein
MHGEDEDTGSTYKKRPFLAMPRDPPLTEIVPFWTTLTTAAGAEWLLHRLRLQHLGSLTRPHQRWSTDEMSGRCARNPGAGGWRSGTE